MIQFNSVKPFRIFYVIMFSYILSSSCTTTGKIPGSAEGEKGMKYQTTSTGSTMSANGLPVQISSRLLNFTELYPQEKLYIHTDKSHYLPGETIWFKTYLTDASSHKASPWSRIVYVELVDESGQPADSRNIEITEGTGHGDFLLDPKIRSGSWVLRGYTSYMLNYSNTPLFSMELKVITAYPGVSSFTGNAGSISGSASGSGSGSGAGSTSDTAVGSDSTGLAEMRFAADFEREGPVGFHVQYFPEGGDLVAGLDVVVGVKVTDTLGMGVDGRGMIYDDQGKFVTGFSVMGFGLGRFEFTPLPGRDYYGVIEYDGLSERFDLPDVKESGYTLQINNTLNDVALLRVQTNEPQGLEGTFLIGHLRGQVFMLEEFESGSQAFVQIDKTGFPAGVVHFTLFTKDGLPVGERLVFIRDEETSAHLDLITSRETYGHRESIEIELDLRDHEGKPLTGDFSVSVTDSYVVPSFHERHNVETFLLLSSDLPGIIENPGFFFNSENPGRHVLLDLVMMTHGWRRFIWDDLISEKYPEIMYPAGSGHILSGKVTMKDQPTTPVRSRVMLSAIGDEFFAESQITDDMGNFYFENLDFPDTTTLVLQGDIHRERRVARLERRGIDDSFAAGHNNWVDFQINVPEFGSGPVDIAAATVGEDVLRAYVEDSRKDPSLTWLEDMWSLEIEEVEIKKQRPVQRTTFDRAFYGTPFRPRDRIVPDSLPFTYTRTDVFDLIRSSSPGVITTDKSIQVGNGATLVILNGVYVKHEDIKKTPIESIAFIDIIRPPQTNMFGAGLIIGEVTGVVVVYSKTIGDYPDTPRNPVGIVSFEFPGYYQAREFYSPKYDIPDANHDKDDYRTTLFWEPEIKPGEDGKAIISFFTSDKASVYRVVVEGITKTGIPLVQTKEIWVQ